MKPLAIDLFCGLGGWTEGLLAEGYDVVGFDIERHVYGDQKYPAQLVLQDVLTLHGSQFRHAALIVASHPCEGYSSRAMPFKRARSLPPPSNELFDACFRLQREACEAAGRYVPMVVENVRGAEKWVGSARWHVGPYYLWGDCPALFPVMRARKGTGGGWFGKYGERGDPGSYFSSKSPHRKVIVAERSKVPFDISRYIASVYKPEATVAALVTERSVEVRSE